jgi:hypothetical protein
MRKRNKVALLLLLPIAVFIWFIGWSLYWMDSKRKTATPSKKPLNGLTFAVLTPEQKYAR